MLLKNDNIKRLKVNENNEQEKLLGVRNIWRIQQISWYNIK
jgi:hypothetical protein